MRLDGGRTAVVAYGSLLSRESVGRTLGRPYEGPFVPCEVVGWRRSWGVAMPNEAFYYEGDGGRVYPRRILYLDAHEEPGASMNAALFVLEPGEHEAMDRREWIYEPRDVSAALAGVEVRGGRALLYAGRDEHRVRSPGGDPREAAEAAVRASYLRIVEAALDEAGPTFTERYRASTAPPPRHLVVDDVLDPDRPSPWAPGGGGYDPAAQPGVRRA